MSNATLNKVAGGETRQTSVFVKSVEAVVIAKVLKYVAASDDKLKHLDPRSPAVVLAKAIKKTIGSAAGDRVGKAYFAYQAIKSLQSTLAPSLKECEDLQESIDPRAGALVELLNEEMTDPDDSHLIGLKESRKFYDYKILKGREGRIDFLTNEVMSK